MDPGVVAAGLVHGGVQCILCAANGRGGGANVVMRIVGGGVHAGVRCRFGRNASWTRLLDLGCIGGAKVTSVGPGVIAVQVPCSSRSG